MTPYRCPTSCDDDCELNGWGCHEAHTEPKRQEHDPAACEARALAENLRGLLEAGWPVTLAHHPDPVPQLELFSADLRKRGAPVSWTFYGVSPGDALARAREWAEREGATP